MKSLGIFVLGFCWLLPPVFSAEVTRGGYLSFEYLKGQSESGSSQGSFENFRGGLFAAGTLAQRIDFILEARVRTESGVDLIQGLVGYKLTARSSFRLGVFLVPFGKYNESNRPYQTVLIRPPLNIEGTYPENWRDVGLSVQGRENFLSYAAFYGNGLGEKDGAAAGQLFKDINKDKGKGGRLGIIIGEGFEVGGSYYSGKFDRANSLRLKLEGLDLTWVTKDYEVRGEYTRASWKNPGEIAAGTAEGFYALLCLNYGKIQPVVSFQKYDPGNAGPGYRLLESGAGFEAAGRRTRWALGARYTLDSAFVIKIEYDINREKTTVLKNNVLQIQAALSF
jgi:hypothetical protein